ncbi:ketoacyl-ACP synthase III [Phytohabitans flavus]|uniref:3-oxoacyl-[acyl-carrier-protein] synthase 3 protein 1 n=1 Tax=Phytohabitans flavus TaxID=1076124 RepID=A0A6F8XLN6_9ACTN|nr:beta-ketoacyl-ACP synthase 3 [Phytohabitans flavus]BCB74730.1 3-oxoacyl-[acyl-carrier-protein] synthase 3 protein 1 [Phytohabitans flavus]
MTELQLKPGTTAARILGLGTYRPTTIVGNDTVGAPINSSDEWIRRRTGILRRRHANTAETIVEMAAASGRKALADAAVDPGEVGVVILASMSYLDRAPTAAPRVAYLIGATAAAGMDLGAACAGFSHALAVADSLVRGGSVTYAVVIGSERMSDIVDRTDRGTAFLFGDGAGAVVVGPSHTAGIGSVVWGSAGESHALLGYDRAWREVGYGGRPPTLRMEGREIFRWAVQAIPEVASEAMRICGVTAEDLTAFIPHQANARIVESVASTLRLPARVHVALDVTEVGTTSAASIPLAMDALRAEGRTAPGDLALLVGFGAGLSYSAQVVALP